MIFGEMWVDIFVSKGKVLSAHTAGSVGCVSGRIILLNIKCITGTAHLSPLGSSKTISLLPVINPNHCYHFCSSKIIKKVFFFFLPSPGFHFKLVTH